jgi:hypothetical protein
MYKVRSTGDHYHICRAIVSEVAPVQQLTSTIRSHSFLRAVNSEVNSRFSRKKPAV